MPYTDDQIANAVADLKAQADPDNRRHGRLHQTLSEGGGRATSTARPGIPTEMDALVAYLQMLGTLVDFKLYNEKANLR